MAIFFHETKFSACFCSTFCGRNITKKSPKEDFFATQNLGENLPVFHSVFTKCPCGILEGFGDVPQQAFLKFISEIALMCTSPVSSEMGECVHECVACYSEKSADTGIKFSGKYVWRCWNLVETLRQICYTFKRQYHNGRRLTLHGGTVTLRSHRDLYGVQKYMDKGGDTNDDYGRSACGGQPCVDCIRTGIYHRQ